MKVAAQEIEHSQVVLDIEVEDERVERAVDQAYKRVVQRINVPGFRKGKAPRALVERMVGRESLLQDAVEQLVPQVIQDAVKQQELTMVARLREDDLQIVSTQPLQVKATVPVQPKVELGDYKSLKIEATPAEVTDDQVEKVIERLQESNATQEPVERAVEMGDQVSIDILAKAGERVIIDQKDAEFTVDPERPQPFDAAGFAEALVGQQAEETRTFTLTLPEDHRNEELKGQDVEFTVTVHWVKAKILPPLDDEFPSVIGTDHESLEALRGAIRENLTMREEHERRMAHEEEVINSVVEQATLDLPPQLVEEEAGRLVQQLAQNLERQGIPLQSYLRFTQKTEEQFRGEMVAQAERNVRRSEVLNAIALAEGIDVSDDEIREQLEAGLEDTNQNRRLVRDAMKRPDVRERFAAGIRRERAARMLLETVGGVDFAALEAAAAAAAEEADPVDEAVNEAEMVEQLEEIDEMLPEVEAAVEALAEAQGISTEEAAEAVVGLATAQLEIEMATGAIEEPAPATTTATAEEPAAADGETRQAPGDKTP